jgi:hypothetical protein
VDNTGESRETLPSGKKANTKPPIAMPWDQVARRDAGTNPRDGNSATKST